MANNSGIGGLGSPTFPIHCDSNWLTLHDALCLGGDGAVLKQITQGFDLWQGRTDLSRETCLTETPTHHSCYGFVKQFDPHARNSQQTYQILKVY